MAAYPLSRDNFAANLRWLCETQPSIASVCRQTGINRQQFNRYLAGNAIPSAEVMRRICALFGVPEAAMFLSRGDLKALTALGRNGENLNLLMARLGGHTPETLKPGYYFRYEATVGQPDRVTRTLCWLKLVDGSLLLRAPGGLRGLVMQFADTSYLFEADLSSGALVMGIFSGNGVLRAGLVSRADAAARAVLEYLGEGQRLRNLIKLCGTVPAIEISPEVTAILKPGDQGQAVLTV